MKIISFIEKELNLWNKIKYLNLNIFRTRCCKPVKFQTLIIWFNRIHSLKYLRSTTFGSKDIVIRKSEFVSKTQFLYLRNDFRTIFNTKFNLHIAILKEFQGRKSLILCGIPCTCTPVPCTCSCILFLKYNILDQA